jgi:methyl-accepting chemotaxis protein
VVAEEIKNLSSGIVVSTKDIAAIVHSLQQDTKTVVQIVHDGVQDVQHGMQRTQGAQAALNKIGSSAQRSSDLVAQIADALHGLIDISHQVSSAMDSVNAMAADITMATSGQKAGTGQIHEAVSHINTMTSQIRKATADQLIGVQHVLDATNTVTALIDENLQSSEQITSISEELSSQATLLLTSVDRFKLPL